MGVSSGRWPSKEHHAVATASNLRCCSTGSGCCCCCCLLLLSDMLLQQLLLVTLLVAPMGGAPAAPAPPPQEDVGEEGGGRADINMKLPGSITRRAQLFQRPRPRIGSVPLINLQTESMQRQSRPRSLGGRRLKSGSEINSLQNSLQGAIKEEPGAKDQT